MKNRLILSLDLDGLSWMGEDEEAGATEKPRWCFGS